MLHRGTSLLAAAVAAAAFAAASPAASPVFSTTVVIHVTYATDCTFTVTVDGGITIDATSAPGTTIPPGPYQLAIRTPLPDASFDPSKCNSPLFSLTGPNVSYSTTVGQGFNPGETTNWTFPPSSTYTMTDGNPPATKLFFTTAATGTSTDLLPPPPPVPDVADTGAVQKDLVGSKIVPFRGKLAASVSRAGKPTLESHGRPLKKIAAGRYDIVVRDTSPKAGFFVQKTNKKPTTIASIVYMGERTVRVNLTAGTWKFFSKDGKPSTFVVTT